MTITNPTHFRYNWFSDDNLKDIFISDLSSNNVDLDNVLLYDKTSVLRRPPTKLKKHKPKYEQHTRMLQRFLENVRNDVSDIGIVEAHFGVHITDSGKWEFSTFTPTVMLMAISIFSYVKIDKAKPCEKQNKRTYSVDDIRMLNNRSYTSFNPKFVFYAMGWTDDNIDGLIKYANDSTRFGVPGWTEEEIYKQAFSQYKLYCTTNGLPISLVHFKYSTDNEIQFGYDPRYMRCDFDLDLYEAIIRKSDSPQSDRGLASFSSTPMYTYRNRLSRIDFGDPIDPSTMHEWSATYFNGLYFEYCAMNDKTSIFAHSFLRMIGES